MFLKWQRGNRIQNYARLQSLDPSFSIGTGEQWGGARDYTCLELPLHHIENPAGETVDSVKQGGRVKLFTPVAAAPQIYKILVVPNEALGEFADVGRIQLLEQGDEGPLFVRARFYRGATLEDLKELRYIARIYLLDNGVG